MVNHKFGFHINAISKPVADAILRIKPQLIKTLHHDVNFWRKVRQILPDTFIVGRLFDPTQQFEDDPVRRGREFAERILREEVNRFEANGRPIYNAWESFNEVMSETSPDDKQKRYDAFQVAFAEKMKAAGFEAVAMNFATGNFLGEQFLKNFQGTLETHKYLGFHEYDWPTLDRLHKIGLADGNGGMWLALRYRRIMQVVRQQYPNRHTAIITELGMTQGVQGGPDVGPWDKSHPISPDDYWQSLLWYNSEIMKDDYVLGACLFVVGAAYPWESFEQLGPIMERLATFQEQTAIAEAEPVPTTPVETDRATPSAATEPTEVSPVTSPPESVGETTAPPISEPTPPSSSPGTSIPANIPPPSTPPPAFPGVNTGATTNTMAITMPSAVANYHSHYFLFPKNTPVWWYAAAQDYFEHFGVTRGERLADALFLRGAQGHTITCLNPSAEVVAKIKQLNPIAKLDILNVSSPAELAEVLRGRILQNVAFE